MGLSGPPVSVCGSENTRPDLPSLNNKKKNIKLGRNPPPKKNKNNKTWEESGFEGGVV